MSGHQARASAPRELFERLAAALAAAILVVTLATGLLPFLDPDRLPSEFRLLPENSSAAVALNRELGTAYRLFRRHSLQGKDPDALARFIAARRFGAILVERGEFARAAAFYLAAAAGGDRFTPWYLFSAAGSFEADGGLDLAVPLYERIVKTLPDLEVEGASLHMESLNRLVASAGTGERAIAYYRDLIARFPDRPDPGVALYLLALEYERAGQWDLAIRHYSLFLPWFGTEIPGHPDALERARRLVEFNSSPRNWGYGELGDLVAGIRKALASGSAQKLRSYAARVGFFAESWHQDGVADANSRVLFDFSEFMKSGAIKADASLDPTSGPNEAYLRTWGWTGRMPVWYLYFRKIHFPADPAVHGQWEWAGIYFGERMR